MQDTHVHTTLTAADFPAARQELRARLRINFLADLGLFLIMSVCMAIAMAVALDDDHPHRSAMLLAFPAILAGFGLVWASLRYWTIAIPAGKRLSQLEARTLAGEAVSCEELERPTPIRSPSWLN